MIWRIGPLMTADGTAARVERTILWPRCGREFSAEQPNILQPQSASPRRIRPVADWPTGLANHNGDARIFSRASPDVLSPEGWSLCPSARPRCGPRARPWSRSRGWRRTLIAAGSAQPSFVVVLQHILESFHVSGCQISIAYWRDNKIPD
jgi:hypothetical protein